ncbi:MAG: glycoside hydrolase family 172 protein [bacterium]
MNHIPSFCRAHHHAGLNSRGIGFKAVWLALALAAAAAPLCKAETLDDLPLYKDYHAARESSYDRSGGNFDMRPVAPGETLVLADLKGPGCITHIWFTQMYPARGGLRKLVLRMYFDGAPTPCVQAPMGDFFGLGHADAYSYASEALAVGTQGGLNSFWKMPFAQSARITVTNEGQQRCGALYYYVDYRKYDKPPAAAGCFHAVYRQAMPCEAGKPYTILEATGRGHYAGCNLSVEQNADGWWGEGDDLFFIDGETTPSMWGTGSEDYFAGAWCFGKEYAFPYLGMPLRGRPNADGGLDRCGPEVNFEKALEWHWPQAWRKGDLWNVYRYHIQDPVPFRKSLRLAIEHGAENNERADSYSSVAYWYQSEPHAPPPPLPPAAERMPHHLRLQDRGNGLFEGEDFVDETTSTGGPVTEAGMSFWGKLCSRQAALEWNAERDDATLSLPLRVSGGGNRGIEVAFLCTQRSGIFQASLEGKPIGKTFDLFQAGPFPAIRKQDFECANLTTGTYTLIFGCKGKNPMAEARHMAIDTIQIQHPD